MKEMRDRMERFVILPFSVGCVSESSVAVAVQQQQQQQPRRSKQPAADTNSSTATRTLQEEDEESLASESMKLKFLPLQKPDISYGFHRLCKGFKTLSHQLFAYKDIEDIEESEEEMEIGLPTDVKHVTHIGLDGSTSRSSLSMGSSWENLFSPQDLFSFPSVPNSGQCEIPMETKPTAASPPLVQAST